MNAYLVVLTPIIVSLFGAPHLDILLKISQPNQDLQYSYRIEMMIHQNGTIYYKNNKVLVLTHTNKYIAEKLTFEPYLLDGIYNVTVIVYDENNDPIVNQTFSIIVMTFKWVKTFYSKDNNTVRFTVVYESNDNVTVPLYLTISDEHKNITTLYETVSVDGIGSTSFYIPQLPQNKLYTYYIYTKYDNKTIIFDSGVFYYSIDVLREEEKAKEYIVMTKIGTTIVLFLFAISIFITVFRIRKRKH